MTKEKIEITLSIYPNSYGFGYSVVEGTAELIDYGVVKISPIANNKCLKRFEGFLDFYEPTVVVLRDYPKNASLRSKRIGQLIKKMIEKTQKKKLNVFGYTRENIKNVFEQFKSSTKHEICKTLVSWYPELKKRMPKERKVWESEPYAMSYFDALALFITHKYLS